jgi:hypothetical protein
LNIRIFEQYILGFREKPAEKSGFAGTPRPCHNNCGKVSSCVQQHACQSPLDILHMRNIN